ncbi:MAG: hypothetical protein AAFN74_02005 [Myxococcota bacterium]
MRRRRRSKATRIWIGILVGIVAGNALAAGTYLAMNGISPPPAEEAPPPETEMDAISAAHRIAGLEAIDRGEYKLAVDEFIQALRSTQPAPDLPELLDIARKLRAEAEAEDAAEPAEDGLLGDGQPPVVAPTAERPRRAETVKKRAARPRKSDAKRATATANADANGWRDAYGPESEPTGALTARKQTKAGESSPAPAEASAESKPASDDELPLCPEDWTPPKATTPYAVLPRRCRPR